MASEKQKRANRANAEKSTGPQTPAGKRNSSKNALTHGNYSRDVVIFEEDPKEFNRLLKEMNDAYPPIDAVDRELNSDLAAQFWRLRRIPVQEAALLGSTWETAMLTVFQMCQAEERRKVIEKLGELQRLRDIHGRSGFFMDLTHALQVIAPEAIDKILEAELTRDNTNAWLALSRRETSLRNGIARTLSMIHARRANRVS